MCFCMYCTEYIDLDTPCQMGKRVTNIKEVMECEHYKYNGGVDG